MGRQALLEKSLLKRTDPKEIAKKLNKPKVMKDKTVFVATKDIYEAVREQKTIPDVPLHRMDEIHRNLAESLL